MSPVPAAGDARRAHRDPGTATLPAARLRGQRAAVAAALIVAHIQQADPPARARAIRLLGAGALAGAVLIGAFRYFETAIQDWLYRHLDYLLAHPGTVVMAGLVFVAPLLVIAVFMFRFGRAVARSARLPPPGQAVIRDTAVLTGSAAIARGRLIQAYAVLLGLLAAALPGALWYLLFRVAAAG